MAEVKITYETLFDFLRRERNREELQTLEPSFYEDVVEYLSQKQALLQKFRRDDELLASAESEKARIQFTNIKKILKEIYDRREKKIAILALHVARTGTALPQSQLLPQERLLYDEMLATFTKYRRAVLTTVLAHVSSSVTPYHTPVVASPAQSHQVTQNYQSSHEFDFSDQDDMPIQQELTTPTPLRSESSTQPTTSNEGTKVKFLKAVPRFAGPHDAVFGPFNPGDEAFLPEKIASVLLKKGRVEAS